MSSLKSRAIEFDLLRTLAILSAIFLHFSYLDKSALSRLLAFPFALIYGKLFTVGALFFFTAGVMAYQVYLPQFQHHRFKTSYQIITKGLILLLIYLFYITIMRLATQIPVPTSFIDFLFAETFFLRVIFTFSCIYLFMPLLLFFISWHTWWIYLFLIAIFILMVLFTYFIPVSPWLAGSLFDTRKFHYALFPAFIIFSLGMLLSQYCLSNPVREAKLINLFTHKITLITLAILFLFALYFKLFVSGTNGPFFIWHHHLFIPFREAIIISIFIIVLRKLIEIWPRLKAWVVQRIFLCYGVESLTAFITSSCLINLVHYPVQGQLAKIIILVTLIIITYWIAQWRYDSRLLHSKDKG